MDFETVTSAVTHDPSYTVANNCSKRYTNRNVSCLRYTLLFSRVMCSVFLLVTKRDVLPIMVYSIVTAPGHTSKQRKVNMAKKKVSRGQEAIDNARGQQKRNLTEWIAQGETNRRLRKELEKARKKAG